MKSLSALLGESWKFCLAHSRALLLAAVIFGGVTGVVQARTVIVLRHTYESLMHISPERLQVFAQRMELGDESAMDDLLQEISGIKGTLPVNQDEAVSAMKARFSSLIVSMLPYLFWSFIAVTIIQLMLYAFCFEVAVHEELQAVSVLGRTFGEFLRFFGLFLWVTFFSFIWFPVLGLFYATYYLPKVLFSPMFLLRGSSVRESVRQSFTITKGHWNLVTWYVSVCTLLTMVLGMILSGILQGIGIFPSLLSAIFGALIMTYNIVFVVLLGRDLERAG